MDLLRNIPPSDQMHDHFQQSPWFYNIPDNVSGLELAKLDVAPKKLDFALEKAVKIKVNVRTWSLCKSRWFCKLLDFVKNNPGSPEMS